MTLYLHELRTSRLSLIIWSSVIAFMLTVCVLIYPEMEAQMVEMGDMFSQMGSFSSAFGMENLNFGEFMGYFAVECGNNLGLGGALFAALTGISALAKEEKRGTAELLLTLPVSRRKIVTSKLLSVFSQVFILNLAVMAASFLAVIIIGERADFGVLALIFLANLLMQLEVAAITFGISAFIRRGGIGIGLGIALIFYFLNLIANITEATEFLKYITPYSYTDAAGILADKCLNGKYLAIGLAFTAIGIFAAYRKYENKDIL